MAFRESKEMIIVADNLDYVLVSGVVFVIGAVIVFAIAMSREEI